MGLPVSLRFSRRRTPAFGESPKWLHMPATALLLLAQTEIHRRKHEGLRRTRFAASDRKQATTLRSGVTALF
jgi:hypothetical protein